MLEQSADAIIEALFSPECYPSCMRYLTRTGPRNPFGRAKPCALTGVRSCGGKLCRNLGEASLRSAALRLALLHFQSSSSLFRSATHHGTCRIDEICRDAALPARGSRLSSPSSRGASDASCLKIRRCGCRSTIGALRAREPAGGDQAPAGQLADIVQGTPRLE